MTVGNQCERHGLSTEVGIENGEIVCGVCYVSEMESQSHIILNEHSKNFFMQWTQLIVSNYRRCLESLQKHHDWLLISPRNSATRSQITQVLEAEINILSANADYINTSAAEMKHPQFVKDLLRYYNMPVQKCVEGLVETINRNMEKVTQVKINNGSLNTLENERNILCEKYRKYVQISIAKTPQTVFNDENKSLKARVGFLQRNQTRRQVKMKELKQENERINQQKAFLLQSMTQLQAQFRQMAITPSLLQNKMAAMETLSAKINTVKSLVKTSKLKRATDEIPQIEGNNEKKLENLSEEIKSKIKNISNILKNSSIKCPRATQNNHALKEKNINCSGKTESSQKSINNQNMLSELNEQIKGKNIEIQKLTRTNGELKQIKQQLTSKISQVEGSSQTKISELMATIKNNEAELQKSLSLKAQYEQELGQLKVELNSILNLKDKLLNNQSNNSTIIDQLHSKIKHLESKLEQPDVNDQLVEQVVVYEAELMRKNKYIRQLIKICKNFINEIRSHNLTHLEAQAVSAEQVIIQIQ